MIICKVCSAKNDEQEEFCRVCGTYLPWHGDRIEAKGETKLPEIVESSNEQVDTRLGFWQRAAIALHISKDQAGTKSTDAQEKTEDPETITESGNSTSKSKKFTGYVRKKAGSVIYENSDNYFGGEISAIVSDIKTRSSNTKDTSGESNMRSSDTVVDIDSATAIDDHPETVEEKNEADPYDTATDSDKTEDLAKSTATVAVVSTISQVAISAEPKSPTLLSAQKPGVVTTSRKPGDVVVADTAPVPVSDAEQHIVKPKKTALRKPDEIVQTSRSNRLANPQIGPAEETPSPDDIYCAKCRQFNSPTRVFCRRCGYELHAPTGDNAVITYQPLTWWQRHWHADVKLVPAGERPGKWGKIVSGAGSQGKVWRIISRTLIGALALVLLFSLVGPFAPSMQNWFLSVYHNTENRVNVTYTQVFAMGANATSSNTAHPPAYAVDDADNTWWQSANYPHKSKYPGVGARLTVLFAQKETINKIGWLGGVAGTPQAYLSEARPREIRLTFYPGGYHVIENLKDTQSFQQFGVNASGVTSMVCTILKVYPSATGHAVAITEIEFFQRM